MKKNKNMVVLLAMVLLTGCNASKNENTELSREFFAMDTYMSLSATGANAEEALDEAQAVITAIENNISRTVDNSDIYILNNSDGEIVTVSDTTYEILSIAMECAVKTDGAFDPTICAITDLWNIGTADARIPSDDEINKALETVSYENILLLGENQVQLLNGAEIDLGAVGKGYAADMVVDIYDEYEITRGVISLSGNIYVYGDKEDDTLWSVGVIDPDNTDEIGIALETTQSSVVTTGAYERYYEEDGEIYHHIFNASTGYPTDENLTSVTVISESSTLADIYATALFAMGYDEAIAFAESEEAIEVILIREDNTVYSSEDLMVTANEKYTY